MKKLGLRKGQYGQVRIQIGDDELALFTFAIITDNEIRTDIYIDNDQDLISVLEVLEMGVNGIKWKLESPRLKHLIKQRIKELAEMAERREGESPSPTDIDDIPF